jgi:hypothetical protein
MTNIGKTLIRFFGGTKQCFIELKLGEVFVNILTSRKLVIIEQ